MRSRYSVACLALLIALGGCRRSEDPNEKLKASVEAQLRRDQSFPEVKVLAHGGIVVLSGMAMSDVERMRIEESVRSVPGVLSVDNRLAVQQPPALTGATDEARLAATIQSRLAEFGFGDLRVDVAHGVVTLTGEVIRPRHDEAMRIVVASLPEGYRVEDAASLR